VVRRAARVTVATLDRRDRQERMRLTDSQEMMALLAHRVNRPRNSLSIRPTTTHRSARVRRKLDPKDPQERKVPVVLPAVRVIMVLMVKWEDPANPEPLDPQEPTESKVPKAHPELQAPPPQRPDLPVPKDHPVNPDPQDHLANQDPTEKMAAPDPKVCLAMPDRKEVLETLDSLANPAAQATPDPQALAPSARRPVWPQATDLPVDRRIMPKYSLFLLLVISNVNKP